MLCARFDEGTTECCSNMLQIFILSVMRLLPVAEARLRALSSSSFSQRAFPAREKIPPSPGEQARRT